MDIIEIGQLSEEQARKHIEKIRWPNGPVCIHCGDTENVVRIDGKSARPGLLRCKSCRKQFTVTVGTIFEDSHIPLSKWLMGFHLLCSSKKGFSALQLQRNLGLKSYKSAFHMAHRIRYAMKMEPMRSLLNGPVEVDETYVGARRKRGSKRGRGGEHKVPVVALVERNGKVRTRVVERVNAKTLKQVIRDNVHKDSTIYTDEWKSYKGIGKEFIGGHKTVNHGSGQYVNGDAYTNTAECFFSLLKRGIMGQFHHVSKKHLQRYCDEFSFRWNFKDLEDDARMMMAIRGAEGKRLMYKVPVNALALSKA